MCNALRNSLARAGLQKKRGQQIKTLIESFQYPRKGPGMMWDAAAQRVKAQGGSIHMGTRLKSLRWDPRTKRWTITATTTSGEVATFFSRHVISSAPIRELVASLHPEPICKGAAEQLRYRDFLTVALIVEKPDLFPDNWIYIHEPGVKVGRIQNYRSWSPDMVPDAKCACLGLEYFCFEGDGLWTSSDAELVALAKRELAMLGLVAEANVKDGCVVRQKKAYPVYDEDYRENVEIVRAELSQKCPNLHLVGRNGMHTYNNQDHAMMTAMLTVKNIIAGETIYDVWHVNEDAEYHEAGEGGAKQALSSVRLVPCHLATAAS
jgi:protoporphyrinogen oxidase